jgi:hypothetical protein
MIRRVAFRKAVLAGVAGASAWEAVVRLLVWTGIPMFDIVRTLGMMMFGRGAEMWQWWPLGMATHALVGAIWAVFYAYFFWSYYDFPPILQGLFFSILPMVLAGVVMVPQMDFMLDGKSSKLHAFASGIGWTGPLTVISGHLIYGIVMGAIYTRPVGYPVGQRIAWHD